MLGSPALLLPLIGSQIKQRLNMLRSASCLVILRQSFFQKTWEPHQRKWHWDVSWIKNLVPGNWTLFLLILFSVFRIMIQNFVPKQHRNASPHTIVSFHLIKNGGVGENMKWRILNSGCCCSNYFKAFCTYFIFVAVSRKHPHPKPSFFDNKWSRTKRKIFNNYQL